MDGLSQMRSEWILARRRTVFMDGLSQMRSEWILARRRTSKKKSGTLPAPTRGAD